MDLISAQRCGELERLLLSCIKTVNEWFSQTLHEAEVRGQSSNPDLGRDSTKGKKHDPSSWLPETDTAASI